MENCSLKSTHYTKRYENCSLKSTHNIRWYKNCSLKHMHNTRWYKTVLGERHTIPGGMNIFFRRSSGEGGILGTWCYTRQVGQRRSLQVQGIPGRTAAKGNPRVLVLYQEEWAASIQTESRPIPGNSRRCSVRLSSREGGDVSIYTSGQQAAVV